jgi:hypothetical protein
MRSYLNAVSRGLTKQQLADAGNQFSPTDLWMSMTAADKGSDCGGSQFEPAFDVLVNRGITTLKTAPYSNLQCNGNAPQSWASDAANYKIKSYRMISETDMTVANLKNHLAQGQLISFGARLGDNFMSWSGTGALNSDTYEYAGQHANHAIVLAGYDDSKGSGGAFLVYNSWGTSWGENGCIWIDYNFFLQNFVFIAFVATPDNNVNPNDDNEIDPNNLVSGSDLAAYHAYDIVSQQMPGYRQVNFNIYNSGTAPISSSSMWSVVYMYYNAYNANDYGILTHLYFTNEIPQGQIVQMQQNYVAYAVNKNIPAGKNISAAVFDQPYEYLYMTYYLPPITGYYYMVVMADPFNCVQEANEQNNYFFIANANGYPYYFQNGNPMTGSATTRASTDKQASIGKRNISGDTPMHSPVTPTTPNAYSPDEIMNMINHHKKSGELDRKLQEFDEKQAKQDIGGN